MFDSLDLAACDWCGGPSVGRLIATDGDTFVACSLDHAVRAAETFHGPVAEILIDPLDLGALASVAEYLADLDDAAEY